MLRFPVKLDAASLDSTVGHDKICHVMNVFQSFDPNTQMRFRKELFHLGATLELKQRQVFFDRIALAAATHFTISELIPVLDTDGDDVVFGLIQCVVGLAAFVCLHAAVKALPLESGGLLAECFDEVDQFHLGGWSRFKSLWSYAS